MTRSLGAKTNALDIDVATRQIHYHTRQQYAAKAPIGDLKQGTPFVAGRDPTGPPPTMGRQSVHPSPMSPGAGVTLVLTSTRSLRWSGRSVTFSRVPTALSYLLLRLSSSVCTADAAEGTQHHIRPVVPKRWFVTPSVVMELFRGGNKT